MYVLFISESIRPRYRYSTDSIVCVPSLPSALHLSELLLPHTIPRLPHRKRIPKALAFLIMQMPNQRIPPAERLPTSPNHRHPVEIDDLSLLDDLGRHPEVHCVRRVYPAAHPYRDVRALSVRLDMAFEVGRAAVVLDVGAVGARPAVRAESGRG